MSAIEYAKCYNDACRKTPELILFIPGRRVSISCKNHASIVKKSLKIMQNQLQQIQIPSECSQLLNILNNTSEGPRITQIKCPESRKHIIIKQDFFSGINLLKPVGIYFLCDHHHGQVVRDLENKEENFYSQQLP